MVGAVAEPLAFVKEKLDITKQTVIRWEHVSLIHCLSPANLRPMSLRLAWWAVHHAPMMIPALRASHPVRM